MKVNNVAVYQEKYRHRIKNNPLCSRDRGAITVVYIRNNKETAIVSLLYHKKIDWLYALSVAFPKV